MAIFNGAQQGVQKYNNSMDFAASFKQLGPNLLLYKNKMFPNSSKNVLFRACIKTKKLKYWNKAQLHLPFIVNIVKIVD